jgi:glycosyltransferase involved in cell wall biosynthesis
MNVQVRPRLRVLLVARWPVGGIRSYLRYTYGLLPRDDFDLVLVGPDSNDLAECGRVLKQFDPPIYAAASSSLRDIARATVRALKHEKIDLVHSQGYSSALAIAPWVRLKGIPHVVTAHDMFTDALSRKLSIRLGKIALAGALGLVDVVQPTGAAVEANFRANMNIWPATRARIVTLRNGIDSARFSGDGFRDLRAELELAPTDYLIGFLGRFMAIKGFHCLIKAVEQIVQSNRAPRRPVVIAVGSGGFMREDQALIESKNLSPYFRFLPHTDEIPATLRGLDLVAIPSYSEASPILPMEALAAGVRVVASDCPGLRDAMRDTPGKLFPVGDAARLADCIVESMNGADVAQAKEFRAVANARFDAINTARKLEDLLRELTGRQARPTGSDAIA